MEINCTERELFVFKKIAHAAAALQMPAYIIGGFVRDKLLGRQTKDADIVCVGNGIDLAHAVAAHFNPTPAVAFFKTFGTAQIKLDEFEIEFVGARRKVTGTIAVTPKLFPEALKMISKEGILPSTHLESV